MMNTRLQDSLRFEKVSLPGRKAIVRSRLTIFVVMAIFGLASAPQIKAQDDLAVVLAVHAFNEFLASLDTNNVGATTDGAEPIGDLYFAPPPSPLIGGVSPHASSSIGTLYGTASLGGSSGQGAVFSVNTDGTGFTVLHNFTGGSDGGFPAAGLILSSNILYGTTVNGGSSDNGTVFAMNTNKTGFTVLHNFTARNQSPYTNSDGANPYAALILSGSKLYGTTSDGGHGNAGTVFSLDITTTNFTVLHHFQMANYDSNFILTNSDGANPYARLVLSGGTLYGTASHGGAAGAGAVFAVNTNGTNFMALHVFPAADPIYLTNSDGISPMAGLVLSGNTLYGTAVQGGSGNSGTVFAVNTNGNGFTNLYNFTGGSDGYQPAGALVLITNTLFGTTRGGGNASRGNGTVFALNTAGTGFTVLHPFTAGNYDPTLTGNNLTNSEGAVPQAGLVFSGDTLYGAASSGGTGANGTVFSVSFSGPPQLTLLGITLSGTNLVMNGANGQSGGTYVTWMSTNLSLSLNQWKPVATNLLNVSGNFTLTATNAVDPKALQRFYILQAQ